MVDSNGGKCRSSGHYTGEVAQMVETIHLCPYRREYEINKATYTYCSFLQSDVDDQDCKICKGNKEREVLTIDEIRRIRIKNLTGMRP